MTKSITVSKLRVFKCGRRLPPKCWLNGPIRKAHASSSAGSKDALAKLMVILSLPFEKKLKI